jgi:hypothetical protein
MPETGGDEATSERTDPLGESNFCRGKIHWKNTILP